MDELDAITVLRTELPQFAPEDHGTREGGGPLFHLVMADLYRYYEQVAEDLPGARRYWEVVERLAAEGSDPVREAVHVSLVETFVFDVVSGVRSREIERLQGPRVRVMAAQAEEWRLLASLGLLHHVGP